MDGHRVMPMNEAAKIGDIFLTVTGGKHAVAGPHFDAMKDGAIVANSGHFNVEIDVDGLEQRSETKRQVRTFVEEYTLEDGRRINLLAEGRLVNLGAAEGHPSSVMDMSFANQALAAEYIIANRDTLSPDVHNLPKDLDAEIARIKLTSIGMPIDTLTEEQTEYLASWEMGTA
tara:strand:- start:58 stop:576 length:519 start_codon:yes stop_codon:yes gene_type:complete